MDDDDKAGRAPLWEQFAWAAHPRWEGERARVWADGASLVAESDEAIGDFFQRHPDFERAEPVAVTTARHALRVWLNDPDPLRPVTQDGDPPPPEPVVPPPLPEQIAERPHDLWLSGYLNPGYEVFAVHPDIEALWYVWSDGDGPHPETWSARIWLKPR